MADSGSSGANAGATSVSQADVSSAGDHAGPNESTNSGGQLPVIDLSERGQQKPAPKKPAAPKQPEKSESPDDDDEEFDLEGEKVRKKQLFDDYKRRKEFERASHERMRQAAEQRKQVEAQQKEIMRLANALRAKEQNADPFAIHRAAGASDDEIDAIAEQRLIARMKRAQMTPEQIQAEENAAKLAQYEKENRELKEAKQKEAHEQLKARYKQHWDGKIAAAMESGNLARTAATAAKVASVIAEYIQAGEDIDPVLAAQIVRDNHHTEIRHEFTELRDQLKAGRITHDKFLAYVGDLIGADTVKAIRQTAIKEARDFEPQKPKGPAQVGPPKQKFTTFEEANAWIEKQHKVKHG